MGRKITKVLSATVAAAMIAAVGLTGCSSTSSSGSTSGSASTAAGSTAASGGKITVGLALSTMTNAFFIGMEHGVKQETAAKGYTLIETNANSDISKQLSDAEDLITKKVNVLIINALDSSAIVPACQKAKDAGITLVFCDRGPSSGDYASFLESDNVKMGELAANNIITFLKGRYGSAKGNVVEIMGLNGTSAATDRTKGFHNVIDSQTNIKIVAKQAGDFDQNKSMNVMQNILQANPQIDAVYGANDDCTVGAEKAILAANKMKKVGEDGHIYIIGIDGINQALQAIQQGYIDATISQVPIEMGAQAVDIGVQAYQGKTVEHHIYTRYYVVTKDNATASSNWGNQVK